MKRIFGAKSEQLDYEPARFLRRRLSRRKYVRRDHPFQAPVIAPLHLLQERCVAAPGLLSAIIVGKYCDHLPLYRQEQIWRTRHHLDIPRQTMVRWLAMAVQWLKPIHDHIRTEVMSGGYVQTDEPERSGGSQPFVYKALLANARQISESRQRKDRSGLFMDLQTSRRRSLLTLGHQPRGRMP